MLLRSSYLYKLLKNLQKFETVLSAPFRALRAQKNRKNLQSKLHWPKPEPELLPLRGVEHLSYLVIGR